MKCLPLEILLLLSDWLWSDFSFGFEKTIAKTKMGCELTTIGAAFATTHDKTSSSFERLHCFIQGAA